MLGYSELRLRAKELQIKNWHNRKEEDLVELVRVAESKLEDVAALPVKAIVGLVGYDQYEEFHSILSLLGDNLAFTEYFISVLHRVAQGTEISTVVAWWVNSPKGIYEDPKVAEEVLLAIWRLYKRYGWLVEDGKLYIGELPALWPNWYAQLWLDLRKGGEDLTKCVTAVLSEAVK